MKVFKTDITDSYIFKYFSVLLFVQLYNLFINTVLRKKKKLVFYLIFHKNDNQYNFIIIMNYIIYVYHFKIFCQKNFGMEPNNCQSYTYIKQNKRIVLMIL